MKIIFIAHGMLTSTSAVYTNYELQTETKNAYLPAMIQNYIYQCRIASIKFFNLKWQVSSTLTLYEKLEYIFE